MAEEIRVLIADDHALIRAGLNTILEAEPDIKIVGEAGDGLEVINKALELKPDVILMDIFMPGCTGIEAMVTIKERFPGARILILTISDQDADLFKALKFGAQGYLLKGASISGVVDAIRRTAAGEVVLSPRVAAKLVAEFRYKGEATGAELGLSTRETEVLRLVGEGLTNTEIAKRLFIGESTVRTYLRRLLEKLHLRNRTEAATYAVRHRLSGDNPI
jgi:NarL family two-component system response regulator LiaR